MLTDIFEQIEKGGAKSSKQGGLLDTGVMVLPKLNSKQGEEIMDLFKQLNNEGVTIIQVTHSDKNAAYGSRIINLLDGRIDNQS